jgi:membrane protease subunit (stomatin/prohibitin family)
MGIFDKLKNEFIDIIEWQDNTQDTIVWKFPRYQNEIKMGAKLTVRESQQAVFFNEGTIADVFNPGMHTLQTQNMPILSTLQGWKYGFNSPFKADVYYVNTKQFLDNKWGTPNPIILNDDRFGMIEIRAFGAFSFKISDAGKFVKEVSGTNGEYTTEGIVNQIKTIIITKFTDAVGEGNIPIEKFAANMEELSKLGQDKLAADCAEYGVQITKFLVSNVSMPEELKKEIFEYSRLNKIDMQKLTQFKAAKSIETMAANEGVGGGMMGAGMGMAMGMNMGNMMGSAMGNMNQGAAVPPPMPAGAQYFIAVNGQQQGPFSLDQMKAGIANGQVTAETLVWKQGMASWSKAGENPETAALFGSAPPPPPIPQ